MLSNPDPPEPNESHRILGLEQVSTVWLFAI